MDPILQVLLSWQFILFGLAVSAVMYIIRQIAEYLSEVAHKDLASSKFWTELVLPLAPIILGVVGAIMLKNFPYPGFTPDAHGVFARGDRIIFGLVTGSLSTLMYRVIKSLLYQKLVSVAQGLNPSTTPTVTINTAPTAPNTTAPVSMGAPQVPTEQIPAEHLPSRGQL